MDESKDFPEPREAKADRRGNVTSTGLDPDDWDELEAWRVDRRLSRSEATRRLIRRGLEATDKSEPNLTDQLISAAGAAVLVGYGVLAASAGETTLAWQYVAFTTVVFFAAPWISQAWDRVKEKLPTRQN